MYFFISVIQRSRGTPESTSFSMVTYGVLFVSYLMLYCTPLAAALCRFVFLSASPSIASICL